MKTKINKSAKRVISAVVAVALLIGTLFTANVGVSINAEAANDSLSKIIWSGNKAEKFAGGSGKKDDPYIIKTPEQLLLMLNDENDGAKSVETTTVKNYTSADKYETKTFKMYSGTKYYKVADGITAFYLNNATTYEELEALATAGTAKRWNSDNTVFAGNFDGNGVTIYGLYSVGGHAFFETLDGYATVKNVSFEGAYVKDAQRVAVLATKLGEYQRGYFASGADKTSNKQTYITNDSYVTVSNVSVSNAKIVSDSTREDGNPLAAGLVSTTNTPDKISFNNCFFDGSNSKLMAISGSNILFDGNWTGAEKSQAYAGIAGLPNWGNNFTFTSCVSTGYPIVPMATGITYNRYNENSGEIYITNCYSPVNSSLSYPKINNGITAITKTTDFTAEAMPLLDWANGWQIVDGKPMPLAIGGNMAGTDYVKILIKQFDGSAANSGDGVSSQLGKYGWNHLLTGSGTEADPYMITNALELVRAIGSGGKFQGQTLYYKLACDIDLEGATWINGTTNDGSYKYVAFEGTLDGDGHAVSGLYAADKNATGLIPKLNGGVVKNLHIRNSYAGSKFTAGLIAGNGTGIISGCSVDSSSAYCNIASKNLFTGISNVKVTNSYAVANGKATYYDENGAVINGEPEGELYDGTNIETAKWYKGPDGVYRDMQFAKARTIADVDGDGAVTDYYTVSDLTALRNNLLGKTDYANIYGDVNNDGKVDLNDLVIIRREMVGDDTVAKDGFWRNAEVGKVKIYYAENDTYDMARRMELYLESLYPSVDFVKVAGKAVTAENVGDKENYNNQDNAVVIVKETPTNTNYMNYSIDYNATKNVLTVTGGSFTAVEYAVNEFINNYNPTILIRETKTLLEGSILDATANTSKTDAVNLASDGTEQYLASKKVNGTTYYYAWGDEFENATDEDTTYSADTWTYYQYKNEETGGERYKSLENATVDSLKDLWVVDTDGKLSIKRGYNTAIVSSTSFDGRNAELNGYIGVDLPTGTHPDFERNTVTSSDKYIDAGQITTRKSMLFKQGYAEMRASLPSDGHAFPAWWFLNGSTANQNPHINRTLYNKVYKFNEKWDGSQVMNPTNLNTYKYQMPKAYLEFDIVEFMQSQSKIGSTVYLDYMVLTVHKIYNQGIAKDGSLWIPDWTTGKSTKNSTSPTAFGNTSSSSTDYIHRYNQSNSYSGTVTKYPNGRDGATFSVATANRSGVLSGNPTIQDYFTYGFVWNVNENAKTYNLKVYVDFNNDGTMSDSDGELIFEINQNTSHGSGISDPIRNSGMAEECAVWNQYAYMLLDNAFYTSVSGNNFTDLFKKDRQTSTPTAGSTDKTTFDIEYVRVYQQDGRRDIVTPATEAFNTGNHFGY